MRLGGLAEAIADHARRSRDCRRGSSLAVGAHAIAALAYGAGPVPPCDVIVGPGNAG